MLASIAVAAALGTVSAGRTTHAMAESELPPTTSKALFDWLKSGAYKSWALMTPYPLR